MHTEEEAKTKICPVQSDGGQGIKCDGPRCMAWRWVPQPEGHRYTSSKVPTGYCGLAGAEFRSASND